MSTDALRRTGLLVRHNAVLRLRDPAQLISYIALPMVLMLVLKPLYEEALDSGTLQAVTGPLVMFSVFALSIVGNSILVEREWRTWDRLRASRAGRVELLLGKTGPVLVLLLLQQAVLFAFGCLVVGLPLPRPSAVGYLALAVGIWGLTLLAVGAALATVVRSRGELSVASDLGAIMVSALGGALVPVSLMPGWAQHVAPLSPGYWAMSMLRAAVDSDPAGMLRPALVCLGIALVAGGLASWRLARGWGRSRLM
ncbi:ABC transporter permease [Micromonospora sp. DT46]|uniref:ABC transporter permease n=1 Tax=unclassified Micromonospora TaxID=2617518 RepID=UPI00124BB3B4|nr:MULTISPECIES: ABC transporter permease [unclassified Micromonospora]KAB1162373.1 ABC transporter permease [Micromonospora sp. AMSO12t]WSG01440.1 ABC transporter permease [Micromonospora sp. NBC_01740]